MPPAPKKSRSPRSESVVVSFRTDPAMAAVLEALPDPSRFVREALLARLFGGGARAASGAGRRRPRSAAR
ncbi:MAG: hypothetical protein JNL38_13170 [Myxococcales bacterium]|nr:hypothetical protein [Myxococcales bacterium]